MENAFEDSEMLQRYITQESDEAFGALVQKYLPLVYSAALRQLNGDSHGAEDVAQIVFQILVRRARALVTHPTLTGWFYTTTYHVAQKTLRSERRRRIREQCALAMQQQSSDSINSISWDAIRPVLDAAMLRLSEQDRVAILFRFFENRSYSEIGSKLGLPENTARMRVERALDRLQKALEKLGITSTAGVIGLALAGQAVEAAPTALASTIAAGATKAAIATGTLFLMSSATTKIAGAVVIAGTITGLLLQNQTISRQRAQISQLQTTQLQTENHSGQQIAELRRQVAAAAAAARVQRSATQTVLPAGNAKTVRVSDILHDHPEYQALMRKEARREILEFYSTGLEHLNLAPDKLSRLKDLLTEKRLANSDAAYFAAQAGLEQGTPEFRQARQHAVQDITDQIVGLIGSDGYSQLQYDRSVVDTTSAVNSSFQPDFIDAGVPLTPEQISNFSKLLHEKGARAYLVAENVSTAVDPTTWLSPANNLMLAQASAILSPTQLEVFKNHLAEEGQRRTILASYGGGQGPLILEP